MIPHLIRSKKLEIEHKLYETVRKRTLKTLSISTIYCPTVPNSRQITCIALHPEEQDVMLCSSLGGKLSLWNASNLKRGQTLRPLNVYTEYIFFNQNESN